VLLVLGAPGVIVGAGGFAEVSGSPGACAWDVGVFGLAGWGVCSGSKAASLAFLCLLVSIGVVV
jgi:hypothetical protein